MPMLNGSSSTFAPAARATSPVWSYDPSETTTMSRPASCSFSSATTRAMLRSSLNAGTIAIRRGASADTSFLPQTDQLEQLPRAMTVRVLVEDALTRAAPELGGLRRVVEQLAVDVDRLLGRRDDEELRAGLEPALDPFVRIG